MKKIEGEIRHIRRSSGNHPIRRVVIPQVERCFESRTPDEWQWIEVQRDLFKKSLSRDWITLRQLDLCSPPRKPRVL